MPLPAGNPDIYERAKSPIKISRGAGNEGSHGDPELRMSKTHGGVRGLKLAAPCVGDGFVKCAISLLQGQSPCGLEEGD